MSDADCPFCHGQPREPTIGPDGEPWDTVCGVCTPLPEEQETEATDD